MWYLVMCVHAVLSCGMDTYYMHWCICSCAPTGTGTYSVVLLLGYIHTSCGAPLYVYVEDVAPCTSTYTYAGWCMHSYLLHVDHACWVHTVPGTACSCPSRHLHWMAVRVCATGSRDVGISGVGIHRYTSAVGILRILGML
jgi:hypothetical protein